MRATRFRRTGAAMLALTVAMVAGGMSAFAADLPLRALAAQRGLQIGAAVAMAPFRSDPTYQAVLKREYNILVAENAFKWESTQIGRDRWYFGDTDALVAFAEANGMAVRGHTLAWHNQNPAWLTAGNFSRDEAIAILHDHIATLVGRYKGRVAQWDVVNEAMGDDDKLRQDTIWYRLIGPDYIALAFRFAHEADPAAKLFYNDYNAEGMNAKSDAVYALVKDLKQAGVPIDGVGWQMHLVNEFHFWDEYRQNAARLAALGLDVAITELDVRVPVPATDDALEQQADAYGGVTAVCIAAPNCHTLVTWGFTDGSSWIPGFFAGMGAALPFDSDYRPKPAYDAMRAALAAE